MKKGYKKRIKEENECEVISPYSQNYEYYNVIHPIVKYDSKYNK